MNGAWGVRRHGFSSTERTANSAPCQPRGQPAGAVLVQPDRRRSALSCPSSPKSRPVTSRRPSSATREAPNDDGSGAVPSASTNSPGEIPEGGGHEAHAGPLPFDDEAGGHRLHPAGGQGGHDLLPQHRADLVAVEAVEDAPGLLGVDQPAVEVPGLPHGPLDGRPGDLVEDHAPHRDPGCQHLEQVPGDGLALAVLVGGEIQLAGVLDHGS